ncbi:MAG: hypothetical protein ACI87W_001736 [Halieaceae bacterium]
MLTISTLSDGGFEALELGTSTVTTTIIDDSNPATPTTPDEPDQDPVTLSIAGPATVAEGADTTDYTLSLLDKNGDPIVAESAISVTVTYTGTATGTATGTEPDADYITETTITIPAGSSSQTFDLTTIDDAFADNGETIILTISTTDGGGFEALELGASTVTTTITDADFVDDNEELSTLEDTPLSDNVLTNASPATTSEGPVKVTSFQVVGDTTVYLPGQTATIVTGIDDDPVGELTFDADGDGGFTFTPADDYSGPVPVVTYSMSDDGGTTVGDTSTLAIEIVPVPDKPEPPVIDPTEITVSVSSEPMELNFVATVGDKAGDDVITGGGNYTESPVTVDLAFGEQFKNAIMNVKLSVLIEGSWNYDGEPGSGYFDDYWEVLVDGSAVARFFYNSGSFLADPVITTNGDNLLSGTGLNYQYSTPSSANSGTNYSHDTPEIAIQLDGDGKATLSFAAETTEDIETATITGVTTPLNQYTYAIPITAELKDSDGSETLTMTVTGVPENDAFGALSLSTGSLLTLTDNGGGVWTVTAPAGADISDTLTLQVFGLPSAPPEFALAFTATATEADLTITTPAATSTEVTITFDGETVSPIAIDLDGDGVEYLSREAGVVFTDETTGESVNTAWVAPGDGLLVIDANQSGTVDEAKEYIFTEWSETAKTDMQAVKEVFDTNDNDMLDKGDEAWDQFAVWQDADSDGVTDEGELVSLDELGVESIALNYSDDSAASTAADGDVIIHGKSAVTFTDGTQTTAEDTSFAIDAADLLSTDDDILLPGGEEGRVADSAGEGAATPSSAPAAAGGDDAGDSFLALEAELMLNQNPDDKVDPGIVD